jgi:rhodanese-related sulfurtransferase
MSASLGPDSLARRAATLTVLPYQSQPHITAGPVCTPTRRAAGPCGSHGFERIGGEGHGPLNQGPLRSAIAVAPPVAPGQLAQYLRDGALVVDVRTELQFDEAHIPYHDIRDIPDGIDPNKPVAVVCGSGQRAAVAASLLQRHGAERVIHVVQGGVPRWKREGWAIDEPTAGSD